MFDNPANYEQWMEGLPNCESLSGTPGEVGAKSKLKFKWKKREIEMVETVIFRSFPDELSVIYEAKGVFNQRQE